MPVRWPRCRCIQHAEPLVYLLHDEVPYSQIYRQTRCPGRAHLRRQAQRPEPWWKENIVCNSEWFSDVVRHTWQEVGLKAF